MDLKDLNKGQLILLAVLLSFITSIATGITTVTLMQQAPASVTTPVSRVVQQTVEKIQQVEGKTTTVVVKEEDLVVDAIAKNQPSAFALTKKVLNSDGSPGEESVGRGFVVSGKGIIVADADVAPSGSAYYATNDSGKFNLIFLVQDKNLAFFQLGGAVEGTAKPSISLPTAGDIAKLKAGQKVILLGNKISTYLYEGNNTPGINVSSKEDAGGMVLDLDGDVLGMALFSDTANFVSIQSINTSLAKIPAGSAQ